ncbi:MAG TPA: flagellar export protein FliJ [Stellaceae bacterium]|nr:flagellar export protein FliJ [Stellaceae bacterium]
MSTFQSLIRLHRWQLDERRRELAALEALAAKLAEERRKLEAEDERERQVASGSPEAAFAYAGYARSLIDRRRRLAQSEAELARQIAEAREALAEAYQEVKRYETAEANREKQLEQRAARREQQQLDELGLERFRRKSAGGE